MACADRPGSGSTLILGFRVVRQVVIGYTVGVAAMLLAFWSAPAWLQWLCCFMIGFFLIGPLMLIGLCGAASVGGSEGFWDGVAHLGKLCCDLSCCC